MIRLLFALFMLAFAPIAAADVRDVYTIRDISVDEQAATIMEAREKAMNSARLSGARTLINKITLAEDRAKAGGVPVDMALANRLAAAVDVQDETAGGGRYRGKLAVVFNPATVRAHLTALGVPYVDAQAPLGLLAPVSSNASALPAWRAAFGTGSSTALAPYATATGSYTPSSDWNALSSEVTSARARRGVLAELEGREGAYRAKVSTVTSGGVELVGTTAVAASVDSAARAASALLDDAWKKLSIIRDDSRSSAQAEVRYTSLAEWNTLRAALARSPLVADFRIRAVARQGALVSFSYAGDAQRLRSDLLQRGVSLAPDGGGFVMRSAVSPAGTP